MLWPNGTAAQPPVSSRFGPRAAPVAGASSIHRGVDFVGYGLVRAIAPGRVVAVGTPRGWAGGGTQVWIQHDGFFSRSMHMKAGSPPVYVGEDVPEGRILGVMGMTGTASGVHHHLEITPGTVHYSNTGQVDPVPFIANRMGAPAGGASGTNKGFLMALTDKQQQEIYDNLVGSQQRNLGRALGIVLDPDQQKQMFGVLCGGEQTAFGKVLAGPIADEVHGRRVTVQGRPGLAGKSTTLAAMLAWNDEHVTATIEAAKAGGTGSVDVDALAAKLRAGLAPEIVKALGEKLTS